MDSGRWMTGARTGGFVTLATVLAVLSHVAGGGELPPALFVLTSAVLPAAAGSLLARRPPSAVATTLVLGGAQATMHVFFAVGTAPPPLGATDAATSCGGHAHPVPAAVSACAQACMGCAHATSRHAHGAGGTSLMMLGAHAVAVVLTALAFTSGERAAEAVLRLLRLRLPGSLRLPTSPVAVRLPALPAVPGLPTAPVLRHPRRRGPPVGLAAV